MTHRKTTAFTRRQFLRTLGVTAGALAAGPVLSACGTTATTAAPTAAPAATAVPAPTAVPTVAAPSLKIGVLLPYTDI
ncbi:MAG: hypothetical protein FJ030_19650, partial [Chloroflexi bacterium]|nr:hypothetical protein [Chloroflexota bacterium]